MTALLDIRDLRVRFQTSRTVHALNGVSLSLRPGEVLGLLGESGSGKSVTLKALLRLLPEAKTTISGRIEVNGQDVMALKGRALADFRGKVVSMIFQDPMLALDPVYTVGAQIAETIMRHQGVSRREAMAEGLRLLERVRIPSPERRMAAYPHEMSGGMRQRAMIALAIAARPQLLLADEPTTALDATVQIQVLLLLRDLQRETGMGMIFVTHDIGVAVEVSNRLAVMYAGQIVETGSVRDLIRDPRHPYTRGLLAANLHGAAKGQRLEAITGAPPSLETAPTGCAFAPRCPLRTAACEATLPPPVDIGPGRFVRCIKAEAAALSA